MGIFVKRTISKALLPAVLCLFFNAHASFAETDAINPVPEQKVIYDDVVVTGTRSKHTLEDVPVETVLISREEIERSTARNLPQLLGNLPGVSATNLDDTIGADNLRLTMRGLQLNEGYGLILVNGQRGSRVDFPDALSCGFSSNTMKAVFSENGYEGNTGHILGHPLEIIPMAHPGELSKGDMFPIKVLFHGKPFKGTVSATWEGFSNDGSFPLEEQTNNEGTIKLPIKREGLWLLMVHAAEDYPDNKVCDLLNYTATLTFRIK